MVTVHGRREIDGGSHVPSAVSLRSATLEAAYQPTAPPPSAASPTVRGVASVGSASNFRKSDVSTEHEGEFELLDALGPHGPRTRAAPHQLGRARPAMLPLSAGGLEPGAEHPVDDPARGPEDEGSVLFAKDRKIRFCGNS
jgi:hypothetical protein